MKEREWKPTVPTIKELREWHNQFGRMLKPSRNGTELLGVDGKKVEFAERSRPKSFSFQPVWEGQDTDQGYCHFERKDNSRSSFRVTGPSGGMEYLTYPECDLVLGSNYYVIDQGYSSPGPEIRKILFHANYHMELGKYNAFEIGEWFSSAREITLPVVYYKISENRFRELRDYGTNLNHLVDAVKNERIKAK